MTLGAISEVPRAAPVRRLVSLGDLIDRGPANRYAIDAVLSGQETAGVDQVDLLPGNHELVLLDAVEDPTWVHFYADIGGLALIDELDPGGGGEDGGDGGGGPAGPAPGRVPGPGPRGPVASASWRSRARSCRALPER